MEEIVVKKRMLALMMSVLILLSFSATAMAATTYNVNEQAVIKVFEDGLDVRGVHISINPLYIQMARQSMLADDVDMTVAQSNEIVAIIKHAYALVQEDGGLTVPSLKPETRARILTLITEAAAVVDYITEYNSSTKHVIFRDTKGNVIFDMHRDDVIKNTDVSYQMTAAAMGALAVVMVGIGIIAKKRNFFKVLD